MLSKSWNQRRPSYDYIVIGSGYGGAITAARIAGSGQNGSPSVCVLERGREWPVGKFPDRLDKAIGEMRSPANPLGLYDLLNYRDISVIKGSGLGGTSLINANVAIVPDAEVFDSSDWPASLTLAELQPFYQKAQAGLAVSPHPRAAELLKVKALERRSAELGIATQAADLAVNFDIDGPNAQGVAQVPCNDCGDCVTGCNTGAKNTLYMNYLPAAAAHGAEIFTQAEVDWIEKLSGGGWRIHGKRFGDKGSKRKFTLDAGNVILAAGSINSTEILMRSEKHGLTVSPLLGTRFGGNGDFFGLAYNGDSATNVLGFGTNTSSDRANRAPGPTIVGVIRYDSSNLDRRYTIEDLSFPAAYVDAAKAAFPFFSREDTDTGDEAIERKRIMNDLNPLAPKEANGALNHTMLYLCMGMDNAGGSMEFKTPWFDRNGRMTIHWSEAGRQPLFARINGELLRHSRSQGGSFIENPMWRIFDLRHLITAHPLGGCPLGEDNMQGAVDEFGRVFSGDGAVHDGLYVADGAILPSALGVNPFLTISAMAERIADRIVRHEGGEPFPQPKTSVGFAGLDALDVIDSPEFELEKLFRRAPSQPMDVMFNAGGRTIDRANRTIRNDEYWKGLFPKGHVLNAMSAALFAGFKKRFFKSGQKLVGLTSDTDGNINARNSLQAVTIKKRTGDLDPGEYILLTYDDPPWQGYYDVFKVINDDLLIGRVYLGHYPHGIRLFTFPMTRSYGFDKMTVEDHRDLWDQGGVPTPQELHGVWRMDAISNANQAGSMAYLQFDHKPDGRLEARYQLLGLVEGLVTPSFVANHFQLHDFTPFHDEIRKLDDDLYIGKYVMGFPAGADALFPGASLGLLHTEPDGAGGRRFGLYYLLHRTLRKEIPTNLLLAPFLDTDLPAGVGMTFDEKMVGWQQPEGEGKAWETKSLKASGIEFQVRMTIREVNEFITGAAHEAQLSGTISFADFEGNGPLTAPIDPRRSLFNYLRVDEATREAEMRYHLEFSTQDSRRFVLDGKKFMQKNEHGTIRVMREILEDYTTLFCHLREETDAGMKDVATALMKFRTFEDLSAVRNLTDFMGSFRVTGTADPIIKLRAQVRFLAFTAGFVLGEYDPLAPGTGALASDVRGAVLRGATEPDFFSTRPTAELQAILRDTPTRPIEELVNTGKVRIDFAKKRIFRDSFWKGSFAEDTLLGWQERLSQPGRGMREKTAGAAFAPGSFWKRFDKVENGVGTGEVVNYEIMALPGDPEVRRADYPDNARAYFRQGDPFLLLKYRNDPYKIVYDAIKIIDDDSAIGVMHLGQFPGGFEFATFVMERHNYPFEKMSVEDHQSIFGHNHVSVPTAAQVEGNWQGNLVFLTRPNVSLLNSANPVAFRLQFVRQGNKVEGRYRFGLLAGSMLPTFTDEFLRLDDFTVFHDEIRMIDNDTMIGKWVSPDLPPVLLNALDDYVEPDQSRFAFYYVLTRV